jgi:polyphosphate kinase
MAKGAFFTCLQVENASCTIANSTLCLVGLIPKWVYPMNQDPAIAHSYRTYSAPYLPIYTGSDKLKPAPAHPPREGAGVASDVSVSPSSLPLSCFGSERQLPTWLMEPWELLQSVAKRRRPLAARLADLSKVAEALDGLFTCHLPTQASWFDSPEVSGLSLAESLPRWVDAVIGEATDIFLNQLRPDLATAGISIQRVAQLEEWQREWLHQHFMQRIYPLLTPLAVDPGRPFPYISSGSLNLLVELRRDESPGSSNLVDRGTLYARVKIPRSTPRLVAVPTEPPILASDRALHATSALLSAPTLYVCSADLVSSFVHHLFAEMPVKKLYLFRVVRGEQPLPGVVRPTSTRHRRQEDQPVVRLDVEQQMAEPVLKWLLEHLHLPSYAVAKHERLFDWSCLPSLALLVAAINKPFGYSAPD